MRIPKDFRIIVTVSVLFSALPDKYRLPVTDFLESLTRDPGTCGKKDCRNSANMYEKSMDRNVDPCVNFYKFSCDGWARYNPSVPENELQLTEFNVMDAKMENLRKVMLESAPDPTDILPIHQAKKFYQSCMNTDARKTRGIKTIGSMLKSNGGWPMTMNIEDWEKNAHSWQEVDENFTRLGADYAFYYVDLRIIEIPDHSRPHEFKPIHCIILHAPRDDKLLEFRENYTEYQSMLKPVVGAFIRENGADVSAAQLENDIHDLYIFEKKLYETINSSSIIHSTVKNLPEFLAASSIPMSPLQNDRRDLFYWDRFIQRLFKNEGFLPWPISVEEPYYHSLPGLWAATDERTIVNYIHWKFVSKALNYTTGEIEKELFGFNRRSSNLTSSQRCRQETEMIHAEVYWFTENHFGKDIEKAVAEIARNVKKELAHQIENSTWLSDDGKAALKEKLERIKISNAVREWQRNKTAIEYHYDGLTIGDDYVANILSFQKYKKKYALHIFTKREEYTRWVSSPLEVVAYYTFARNCIGIQAAFLQWPFFSSKLPNYVNYGITGMTIGHELGHAIIHELKDFKSYNGSSILKPDMLDKAQKQFSCIREYFSNHYSNKTIADQTLSEDLCDSIGIRSSLDAYKLLRQNEESNEELKLPGFEEFSDEQMFFLSLGQFFCGVRISGSENRWLDVHSPAEFRLNAGVSNTPEFAEAFNCPLGSPMNPTAKCSIWKNSASVPNPLS